MTDRINLADEMRRQAGLPPADDAGQEPASTGDARASEIRQIVAVERTRALEVMKACDLAGRQDLAGDLIASGVSLGDALRTLEKAKRTGRGPGRA